MPNGSPCPCASYVWERTGGQPLTSAAILTTSGHGVAGKPRQNVRSIAHARHYRTTEGAALEVRLPRLTAALTAALAGEDLHAAVRFFAVAARLQVVAP